MSDAASPARIGVVVVTHDTRRELAACLDTLVDPAITTIVVADTGSTDGTAAAVAARAADDPRLRYLPLANSGFGRAANAGMRCTEEDTIVVCNADVRLGADAPARLRDALLADPGLGAVGPVVRYPSGRLQASARAIPDLRTAVVHALLGRIHPGNAATRRYHALPVEPDPTAAPRPVGWLSGCALALRRRAVEEVAGFDPGYFLYVEDLDLAVRLRACGWGIAQATDCEVLHAGGASTGAVRLQAMRAHVHSLERFLLRTRGPLVRAVLRPGVRLALFAWAGVSLAVERWSGLVGAPRSSTGERR